MIVGTVTIRLALRDARTLKDKRRILSGIKEHLSRKFNVSVAEVDCQDMVQSATLGVAQVGNDSRYLNAALDKLVQSLRRRPAADLIDYSIEIH